MKKPQIGIPVIMLPLKNQNIAFYIWPFKLIHILWIFIYGFLYNCGFRWRFLVIIPILLRLKWKGISLCIFLLNNRIFYLLLICRTRKSFNNSFAIMFLFNIYIIILLFLIYLWKYCYLFLYIKFFMLVFFFLIIIYFINPNKLIDFLYFFFI
jgi:hypothetical protein